MIAVRDTQLESWTKTRKILGSRQLEVLEVVRVRGGAAGFEVASVLHRETYTVLPRITELAEQGFLRDSGRRVWNRETKRRVIVWESV
jgi:hypothetical protein